ncbi:MAG TPA: hypothetical protein VFA63_17475 [Pseudonocardiaceae bacterium]|jgi:hypothetical protein|nr:hypothetical protein [Pseudonocardiaceae bacterium]
MTLVAVTVVITGLLIAALAIYLFMVGVVRNRIAGNLGDGLHNAWTVAEQVQVVGPGINRRLNKTGGDLLGATLHLIEAAEAIAAKLAPCSADPAAPVPASPAPRGSAARQRVLQLTRVPFWLVEACRMRR